MYSNISEEKRDKVLNDYQNTKKRIKTIAIEQGLSYEEVVWILEQGEVSSRKRSVECSTDLEEYVRESRKKGLSYEGISKKIEEQGRKISRTIIRKICEQGKDDVILDTSENTHKTYITYEGEKIDNKILELRGRGLSFEKIAKELLEQGILLTKQGVHYRYKRMSTGQLKSAILKLKITKNATPEQLQQIAKCYGIDLDNAIDER